MQNEMEKPSGGLPYALGTYLFWGLFPLYFAALRDVPPFEMVGWRIVFTIPFCLVIVGWRRQWPAVRKALADRRTLLTLCASSLFIGANWTIYVWSVQQGHVLAASLGYYINPLLNVLAGTVFLRERLNPLQWAAVALAGVGVAILAWGALPMLWISLGLALSFCSYGLVRKLAPVEALPGLTIESFVLLTPGLIAVALPALGPEGSALQGPASRIALLSLAGVFTGLPLLLFSIAARRMDYSTLGFVQYLTPTLVFALGLFVFGEPLNSVQLICFALIWTAIALFSFDLFSRRKRRRN